MKTRHYLSTLAVAVGLAAGAGPTGTAHAGTFTQVKPASLKYDGKKYWRKQASEANLGSVGFKMAPAAGKNYYQHQLDAPSGVYKVTATDPVPITTSIKSELGVNAEVSTGGASVGAGGKKTDGYTGKITAFKLKIDIGDSNTPGTLRYVINRNPKLLKAIKDNGNKARVISAIWVLVAGSEEQAQCLSGNLSVSDTTDTMSVSASASQCTTSAWALPPGSIIGYEMMKINEWDKEELTQKPSCARGAKYEIRKSPATPQDRCKTTKVTGTTGVECKLAPTDKAKNWYVKAGRGRDVCKSKKGKKDKGVKCKKSGYSYRVKAGADTCEKGSVSYAAPTCPAGYDYDKKSTKGGGQDMCELKGIKRFKADSMDGF